MKASWIRFFVVAFLLFRPAWTVTVNGASAQHRKGSFFRHQLTVNNTTPAYTAVTVTADTTKTGNILTPPASQSFGYDGDGNMTGDAVFTYTYNGENQLIEVQSLSGNPAASKKWDKFTYDWRGRRIQKSTQTWNTGTGTWNTVVLTRYLYSGWNLIGELNGSSGNAFIRGYIWGLDLSGTLQSAGGVGGLIAENDAVNGVQFAVCDDMGNVVGFVKGSDGTVTATYEYDPFGNLIRATGPYASVNPIRFSSKYFDEEVGLSFFGGRYYNASLGRWLNRDPLEEWGGKNLYEYCYDNPQSYIDPLGFSVWGSIKGAWNWWFNPPYMGPDYMTPDGQLRKGPPPAPIADLGDDMGPNDVPSMATGRGDQMRSGADDAVDFRDELGREGIDTALGSMLPAGKGGEMLEKGISKLWKKCPFGKAAKKEISAAEKAAEEIAKNVQKSPNIRNKHLAGQKHQTGIPFDKNGFPDFSSVSAKDVQIKFTGNRLADERAANEAAGFATTPDNYTWHHHQDGKTMQLVPSDIHSKTGHTGGFSWP